MVAVVVAVPVAVVTVIAVIAFATLVALVEMGAPLATLGTGRTVEVQLVDRPPPARVPLSQDHSDVLRRLRGKADDLGRAGAGAAGHDGPRGPVGGNLDVIAPGVILGRMGMSISSSAKDCGEPMFTARNKLSVWSLLVLKRVRKLPSRALAGPSVLAEGALVLATQPVRAQAFPPDDALQFAAAVVAEVVEVVLLGQAAAGRAVAVAASEPATIATVAALADAISRHATVVGLVLGGSLSSSVECPGLLGPVSPLCVRCSWAFCDEPVKAEMLAPCRRPCWPALPYAAGAPAGRRSRPVMALPPLSWHGSVSDRFLASPSVCSASPSECSPAASPSWCPAVWEVSAGRYGLWRTTT